MLKLLTFGATLVLASSMAFASESVRRGSGGGSSSNANADDPEVREACKTAYSARLALASIYSSCTAPQVAEGDLPDDSVCNSSNEQKGETLQTVWAKRKKDRVCKDSCTSNCKHPTYSQEEPRIKVEGEIVDPAPEGATDCSGFISAVNARVGRKFTTNQDPKQPITTAFMVEKINSGESCYTPPPKKGLLPGDLVVWNSGGKGHVFLIDRVDSSDCGKFSIIESTGSKTGSQVSGKQGSGDGVSIRAPSKGAKSDKKGMAYEKVKSLACGTGSGSDEIKVVRHNPKKAGCTDKPKKYKNEDCVKSCENLGQNYEEAT